ncbi:T4 RnlA family RNA ligase [Streptomyces sp. B21-083]|uniref:T4 RnlA family RNA ligase n=1 Tax=Streptomyces sp. B21-083 TaxID=3039410 RepID=UPI002FF2F379
MTHLNDVIPADEMHAALDAGYVTRRQHPTLPLSIYTYSRAAQYERAWTTATIRCRGLIADDLTGQIIAWPFEKFFNVGEHAQGNEYAPPLPEGEPFEVYDKVDGSLGILFHYNDRWHAASKGSFISEQAQWAQRWIDDHDTRALWPGTTYLAEIIYPANRIVVDYGQREDLVLLGAFDHDGTEIPLTTASVEWLELGSVVRTWGALPLAKLLELAETNRTPAGDETTGMASEGYVIRYASGLRAKAKLAEYVRLHKVLTGISERDIWRYAGIQLFADQPATLVAKSLGCPLAEVQALADGGRGPLDALLEQVPDEFDQWVRTVVERLEDEAAVRADQAANEFEQIAHLTADRGQFARAAQRITDPAVRACMFLILDGRPTGLHLWRAIKPEAATPYTTDEEA